MTGPVGREHRESKSGTEKSLRLNRTQKKGQEPTWPLQSMPQTGRLWARFSNAGRGNHADRFRSGRGNELGGQAGDFLLNGFHLALGGFERFHQIIQDGLERSARVLRFGCFHPRSGLAAHRFNAGFQRVVQGPDFRRQGLQALDRVAVFLPIRSLRRDLRGLGLPHRLQLGYEISMNRIHPLPQVP